MSNAIQKLQAAQQHAMTIRPKVGGFPYLAETLRRAGVTRNLWYLLGIRPRSVVCPVFRPLILETMPRTTLLSFSHQGYAAN
jgi:hypothetical protein